MIAATKEQAQLTANSAYWAWSEARQRENEMDFDEWLMSPAGYAWLEEEEERAGSVWNCDGFSPAGDQQ